MADLEVIRFVAMEIISFRAYHGSPEKQSTNFLLGSKV